MRGKYSGYDSWQGGQMLGDGTKREPGLRLRDAGHWDTCGGRCRKPRSDIIMLVVLIIMGVAGVYISALVSSASKQPSNNFGTSSMFGPRRISLKSHEKSGEGIETKGMLSESWWAHSDDTVEEQKPPMQALVLYIFSNTDPEYIDNLRFYVRTAIHENDGCHHVIVVNSGPDAPEIDMPELPSNAKYLHHANECFDWGTFGWALEQEKVQVSDYKYFIFLNSSVRGPFLPPYLQGKMHFSELMTGMLNPDDAPNSIKMVGPSINCEGTVQLPGGLQRSNPHVQSFAVATDQTGMKLLLEDGKVFGCYSNIDETIYHSELGSSDAILRAGYNIASFMSRYQGVNWLDESTWNCNDGINPFNWGASDPYSLQPMELMFVKVKHWPLSNGYPSMVGAVQYDAWSAAAEKGEQDVGKHPLKEKEWESKAERILKLAARGPECWDCAFYQAHNEDLADMPCHDAFGHFVNFGQFEPSRPFQYTCETDWETHGVPFQPDSLGGTRGWPLITATSCEPGPADAPATDTSAADLPGTEQQESQPEVQPEAQPEAQPEEQPEVQAETQAKEQPDVQPETQAKEQPDVQPETQAKEQPDVQPETQAEEQPEGQTEEGSDEQEQVKPEVAGDAEQTVEAVVESTPQPSQPEAGFGFEMYTPGSMEYSDVTWCKSRSEPSVEELRSIPKSEKVLFIAGAQKAGTTWLFNALEAHPTFVGASHAYKQAPGKWSKELHIFNRWPMPPTEEFLPLFPSNVTDRPVGAKPDRVLVDGTPDYMFNSVTAPRIKAVVPQARFVIVLRDPVARAYSAWQMTRRTQCPKGTEDCKVRSFSDGAQAELDADEKRGCMFNVPYYNATWHSCFQCHYSHFDNEECNSDDEEEQKRCKKDQGFGMLAVGKYAAQLAWWFNFFPPERFLIVSSQQLRDKATQMKVLNRIIEHSGAEDAEPFTPETISSVTGYDGSYSVETTPEESEMITKLRTAFDKPTRDLYALLALHHLDEFVAEDDLDGEIY